MPVDFAIPAEGELGVQMFYSKVPWSEDKFAETLEIRPGNRAVVHHAGVFVVDIPEGATIVNGRLVMPDGKASTDRGAGAAGRADDTALPGANKLLSWVPGRGVDSHRADIGKRIPGRQVHQLADSLQPDRQGRRPIARASASGSTRRR